MTGVSIYPTNAVIADPEPEFEADTSWRAIGDPSEPSFENSWANYALGDHADAAFRMDAEGWIHLKGLIKTGSNATVCFTLPVGYRPANTIYLHQPHYDATGSVVSGYAQIQSTGTVLVGDTSGVSTWFSLAGIQFPSADAAANAAANTTSTTIWLGDTRAYPTEQKPILYRRANGMIVGQGIMAAASSSTYYSVSGQFDTSKSHIFGSCDDSTTSKEMRLSNGTQGISQNGTTTNFTILDFEYGSREIDDEWVEVDGGIGFQNSWVNFGSTTSDYANAAYYKDQYGFVHLQGMVKSGTIGSSSPIFTLPSGYRPSEIHLGRTHSAFANYACRLQVDINGDVLAYTNGSATWTSLSGLHFYADGS